MPILEDIAERLLRIDAKQRDLLRRDLRAHDEVEQAAQQREEDVAEANQAARARKRTGRGVGHRRFRIPSAGLLPILDAMVELVKLAVGTSGTWLATTPDGETARAPEAARRPAGLCPQGPGRRLDRLNNVGKDLKEQQ